jgi:uncharacterized membrane protein
MQRRTGTSDYLRGALWVMPLGAVALALAVGSILSSIELGNGSRFDRLLFQGTADDARTLLIGISGTMMTVIALVLGLTLVALQLSSTQFSPRLLRYFLRDRVNQVVLSVFVATFVYSTAGLYTVGVDRGARTDDYPRLAVTFALVLLFASLIVLVYFVHHISHSIQVDEVMSGVERTTLRVVEHDLPKRGITDDGVPAPPPWAVAVPAHASGYVQTIHAEPLVELAAGQGLVCSLVPMVGEHLIVGEPLAWLWRTSPEEAPPDADAFTPYVRDAVRIGYERTNEQDVAFGIRQLADIAAKALSPAVNDPYTAMQATEHLAVVLAALAPRPLGNQLLTDDHDQVRVSVPGRDFATYLELATGQVRRYGCAEPRVLMTLLRALAAIGGFCPDDERRRAVAASVALVEEAAGRGIVQDADRIPITDHARAVHDLLTA